MPPRCCSNCKRPGHTKRTCTNEPVIPVDVYTPDVLRLRYALEKEYTQRSIEFDTAQGIKTRRNGLPEHISENIVKYIVHNYLGDLECRWQGNVDDAPGDLSGGREVKSFTSDGPITFGPTQPWRQIFFLDAREWLNDELVVWMCDLPDTHEIWKNLKVSKKDTKGAQASDRRRPRLPWKDLYPQIKDHCKKVYQGTFEGIFTPPESAPVSAQPVPQ